MAEKINYVKEVRKSIITEYAEFKDEMVKKSPEEVYAEFGKIYAYENLHRSLAGWIFDEDVRDSSCTIKSAVICSQNAFITSAEAFWRVCTTNICRKKAE